MVKRLSKDCCSAVLAISGAVLMMFCLGHFYTLGNMSPYIMSYLWTRLGDKAASNSLAVWLSAGSLACQGIALPVAGILVNKIGVRPILIFSLLTHR
ncbi:unnamed protein product [Mesocestoides corti]|uniref:MFS domain-containing protein n=1 Tax=Mesocestoides corti TaxID=53468 RepID=A0A0R3ULA0_MESCO|nr:unnamed protein product [Mesocestoides corti]